MEMILNQEEIDQLFRAAQGPAPKAAPIAQRRVARGFDFRQAGQLSKEAKAPYSTSALQAPYEYICS
jgi:hypothetical protein